MNRKYFNSNPIESMHNAILCQSKFCSQEFQHILSDLDIRLEQFENEIISSLQDLMMHDDFFTPMFLKY